MLNESEVAFTGFCCNWDEYLIPQDESKPRNSMTCISQQEYRHLDIIQQRESYLVRTQASPSGPSDSERREATAFAMHRSSCSMSFEFISKEAQKMGSATPTAASFVCRCAVVSEDPLLQRKGKIKMS